MSIGAARAATFGASLPVVEAAGGPLPQGLAIMSAAAPTKHNLPGYSIARDASGDLYVPSYFYDTVDGKTNAAVTKYDGTTMAVLWPKHMQSAAATDHAQAHTLFAVSDGVVCASNQYDTKGHLSVTKLGFDGALVWTKHISDTGQVNTARATVLSTGDIIVAAQGAVGLLVVRLTSAGAEVWKKDYTAAVTLSSIVVDASDNIFIGGYVADTVNYLGLVKLNSAGVLQANPRWNLATVYNAYCYSLSLDSGGNVYLAGRLTNSATATDSDGYVMKLNSSLVLQWARKIKAAPTDQYDSMQAEVGPDDMVYVVGYTGDADAIGDGFLAKYDTAGILQWKRSLVTGRTIGARPAILVDATNVTALLYGYDANNVYDTCTFTVPIDGTGLGTYNDAVYADATNVTDSEYTGVTAYGNFGLTEVASSAVIGAGDETLLESGLTSTFHTVVTPYRYYKLAIHTLEDDANPYAQIGGLQLMSGVTAYPTVDMTSNVLPAPLVASADSEPFTGSEAYKAFNGLVGISNQWYGSHVTGIDNWLSIDLGTSITITACKISAGSTGVRSPESFTVLGSATGAFAGEETTLHTVSGETGWAADEERTFTF